MIHIDSKKLLAFLLAIISAATLIGCIRNTNTPITPETQREEKITKEVTPETEPVTEIPETEPMTEAVTEAPETEPGTEAPETNPEAVTPAEPIEKADGSHLFVNVAEVIPDAILEIRYYSTFNFVGERIDGYEEPYAFLTKEAAQALKTVSDAAMEKGYRLKLYDCYRPVMAVAHFVRWSEDANDQRMKEYFYPELEKSLILRRGYVATRSNHSRGSTVDLTLVDMKTGRDVDMGGGFDYFGELSHTNYTDLTQEQINNRNLLRQLMIDGGFSPITSEWWHFNMVNEPYPNRYFNFPINSEALN